MRRRFLVLVLAACNPPAPAPHVAAQNTLEQALVDRDPSTVSAAARAAAAFEGQSPELDRLLGDALANVLMRPHDGIELLRAHPAPTDPTWVRAIESAALRTGESAALDATYRETGTVPIRSPEPLVAWMGIRALRDPAVSIDTFRDAAAACTLWDNQPTRGRRTVDQPVPDGFFAATKALGATHIVVGRAEVPTDPPAHTGDGLQPCKRGRIWATAAWPEPLPKHVTVAIATDTHPLYLSVRPEADAPWVFASTRSHIAGELVAAARDVQAGKAPAPRWLPDRLAMEQEYVAPPLAD